MEDVNLSGYFLVPSGVSVVSGNYRSLDALGPLSHAKYAYTPVTYELPRGLQIPEDVLDVFLTQLHEQSHYRQLMSTPFGLMLWRAMNVLAADVHFLARHVSGLRPPLYPPEPPIDEWLSNGGLEQFDRSLREGGSIDPKARPSVRHQGPDLIRYMDFLLQELRVMKFFHYGLQQRSELRVGDFISVANLAMEIMNRRSDLQVEVTWSTRLPPETLLLGDGRFAGNEIIEGAARLEEHRIMGRMEVSPEMFDKWRRTRIFGVYQPVYEHLLDELKDASAALAVLDVAMMTPIDPAFAQATGGTLVVEDVLPSFRLPRLVEAARKRFWPRDPKKWQSLLAQDLATAAGLTAPARLAEFGATATYSGDNSWSYDTRLLSGQGAEILAKPFDLAQEDVRRAMRQRLTEPTAVVIHDGQLEPIRPILTFFDDAPLLGRPGLGDDWLLSVILSYRKFIADGIHLALLSLFETDKLLHCERSMLQRIQSSREAPNDPLHQIATNFTDEQIRNLFGVREIASRIMLESHLYLLQL
jgi:hypothetical protein